LFSQMRLLCVKISYDHKGMRLFVEKAIKILAEHGMRGRKVIVYMLYNFRDTPDWLGC